MNTKLILSVGLLTLGLVCSAQDTKPADTNALGGEILPQITIVDTPLPTAIQNLARMASINVDIDSRITAGTPGPNGQIPAPRNVTIKWENITALQALTALLDSNNLQLVMNDKTKVAKITAKDPAQLEPLVVNVVPLKYSNASNIVAMLTPTLSSRSKLVADTRTGQLIVLSTDGELTQIKSVLAKLDVSPAQILIEARFIETTRNPHSVKGIDWTDTLAAQHFTFGNGLTKGIQTTTAPGTPVTTSTTTPGGRVISTTTTPPFTAVQTLTSDLGATAAGAFSADTARGVFPNVGFLNADGVKAVLSFLNTDSDAESLATPRAVALEGVATELSVVRNIPIFEEEQGAITGGSAQPSTVKPNYNLTVGTAILNEVGIKLIVTPRVYGGSNVFLDLKPEISDVEPAPATSTLGGKVSTAPIFARRKLLTQAMVPTGNTLVLGGLASHTSSKSYTKIPLLGDLPGIGRAFRSDDKSLNKRNLLIFVTPTILSDNDYQPGDGAAFMRTRPIEPVHVEWGPYDSAIPHDWTKPVE